MKKNTYPTLIRPLLILQIVLLLSSFAILYSHTVIEMVKNWMRDDNFSHGFLIPLISLFMIWQKREELQQQKIDPNILGLLIVLLAMCMHIVGAISAEMFTMRSSMLICIMGVVIFFFGFRIFLIAAVPFLYLFFMIPIPKIIWNQIAFPLQLMAAAISAEVVQFIGITVLREGNILHLSNTSLEVVDACSGLRSLMSLLALSAAVAFISNLRTQHKWFLFLSAVPIALLVNIIRLVATAILAKLCGPETAQGFLHDLSGFIVFIVAFILLYLMQSTFSWIEKRKHSI